jgi:hypothetical protein
MRCGCWRSRFWGVMLFVYVPPSFVVLETLLIDFDLAVGGRLRQGSRRSNKPSRT